MVSGQMFSCFVSPFPLTGTCDNAEAMSGMLMRKFEEVGSSSIFSVWESDDEVSSGKSADDGDSVSPSTSDHFIRSAEKLESTGSLLTIATSLTGIQLPLLATTKNINERRA
ncbi:hypothetical protein JD844_022768 [Phrynosoma platyrhinos]|uniref:Uncharacterized protein n=1 Tax=Phrynosoma platyrhinos TaxID=52577 RepID=A0ABQ7SVT7_PHRPL|nr:hypothetical protein JD844_022768 [Phrynosoma platyrhinos]